MAKKTEKKSKRCPQCGYCQECGRSDPVPQPFWPSPWYVYPWPAPVTTNSTWEPGETNLPANTITIGDSSTIS